MFKDIAKFNNTNDYLPILNAILITDLFIILLVNMKIIDSKVLTRWYNKFTLSAVIADVLIIFIGFIIARAIYYRIFEDFSIVKFIALTVVIQIIHDILFYMMFSTVPRGLNKMLDMFKDYANEASYLAIIADSFMMIMACLIAAYLANSNANVNIIILVIVAYVLQFALYN